MRLVAFLLAVFISTIAIAADEEVFLVTIENHRFSPSEVIVPEGRRIKLIVKNNDNSVEEFESFDLNREKLVPGKGEIKVLFGPLKPGTYKFFGEFHEETAQGKIVVK